MNFYSGLPEPKR